jgi:predicted DNA-binding transcriptional regulator YafY
MKCDEWLTNYLRQRPLHASQEEISDGCFQIHVALTQDFTCAILSFGSHVRITKPAELIQQIQDIAQEILKRYQN